MKKLLTGLVLGMPGLALCHPGSLDANWCHDSPTGYHCHKWGDDKTYTPEEVGVVLEQETPAEPEAKTEPQPEARPEPAPEPVKQIAESAAPQPTEETKASTPETKQQFSLKPYFSLGLGAHAMNVEVLGDNYNYVGINPSVKVGIQTDQTAFYLIHNGALFPESGDIYNYFSLSGIGITRYFERPSGKQWYAEGGIGLGYGLLDMAKSETDSTDLSADGLSFTIGAGIKADPWSYGATFTRTNTISDLDNEFDANYLSFKAAIEF